jgi:thymidylate synthase
MEGMTIHVDNLVNGYVDVVDTIIANGDPVSPRGVPTLECIGTTIIVEDPRHTLPVGMGRGVSLSVAALEALLLIGGFTDPQLILKASTEFEKVLDGGAFHGAYGPRAAPQFPHAIERLKQDASSRRAAVTIWDPAADLYREGLHDYPCTMTLEYLIRNDELIAVTHMRSNDVWLGLAYDAFVFTQVQQTIANVLGIGVGRYVHHATSMHIYESDLERASKLKKAEAIFVRERFPSGLPGETWGDVQRLAYGIAYGNRRSHPWWEVALEKVRRETVVG